MRDIPGLLKKGHVVHFKPPPSLYGKCNINFLHECGDAEFDRGKRYVYFLSAFAGLAVVLLLFCSTPATVATILKILFQNLRLPFVQI